MKSTKLSLAMTPPAILLMTWSQPGTTPSTLWPTCPWEPAACLTTSSSTHLKMVSLYMSHLVSYVYAVVRIYKNTTQKHPGSRARLQVAGFFFHCLYPLSVKRFFFDPFGTLGCMPRAKQLVWLFQWPGLIVLRGHSLKSKYQLPGPGSPTKGMVS